jgi:hypothetical protein
MEGTDYKLVATRHELGDAARKAESWFGIEKYLDLP